MQNVTKLREMMKMTQEEFADFCGVSRTSIARYEAGGKISRSSAVKIAEACLVTVDYVLGVEHRASKDDQPTPQTIEARIISTGVDKMTKEQREQVLAVVRAMFANHPELFEEGAAR